MNDTKPNKSCRTRSSPDLPWSVAIAAIALVLWAPAARADDFGATLPDDLSHSVCFDFPLDSRPNFTVAYYLYWGYNNVIEATNYTPAWDPTCTSETDVVFRLDMNIRYAGYTTCRSANPAGYCRSYLVGINPYNTTSRHDMISLGCHEVGHTIGLSDGPSNEPHGWYTDCMATDYTPSETLNQHHINHANSRRLQGTAKP